VSQDTIDYASTAYFEPKKNHKSDIRQLFSAAISFFLNISLPLKT
jgi:hypothetical protein